MVSEHDRELLTRTVGTDEAGERVERLVARTLPGTRSEARALCERGAVKLDGRRVKKGDRAAAGSTLSIELDGPRGLGAEPELPLDVRLERPDLVVVSKPAGMPSAPLAPGERGTLAGALVARYPEMRAIGYSPREPGLVHRLDTNTSGLLLAARDAASFARLVAALRAGAIEKRYLAVVLARGLADAGVIDEPLRSATRGRVVPSVPGDLYARDSLTRYRVLERGPRFALVELEASRAFRHQVRAHLAALGHPIAGDTLYGGVPDPRLAPGHALHASYIAWAGEGAPSFAVSDEAPATFRALLGEPEPPASES